MESTTILRQNHTLKKKNKENVQPAPVVKSFIRQKAAVPPIHTNGNKNKILAKKGTVTTVKQVETRQNIPELSSGKATGLKSTATAKTQSHSQKTEQAAKFKKPAGEAPKPPPALQIPRSAPGTYKGKIVESKIGSIWKSSVPARNEEQKSNAQRMTNQNTGTRTTSAAGRGPTASTSRSVKPSISTFSSARPPARSVPTTVRPRNATVAQSRRCGTLIAKPKVPVTDTKASKPPVTSTVRQYRANSETAEEKRAKLAEWLASKGKTLKRPAMVPSAAKVKISNKPAAAPAPKSQMKALLTTKSRSEAEAKEPKPVTPALTTDDQELVQADKRTSLLLNTTLDLLENSDLDLPVDPQDGDRVDDIVINLCDALEALETPSQCDNELPQLKDECGDQGFETNEECKANVKSETPNNGMVKCEGDDQEVQDESEESDDDCYVDENIPPTEEASVVKYSVKTTPFLQSVKKTIDDEVCSSMSKRKNNIKDLKFLTPVRRSSRIHRQSSRLPTMLVDHDPCVSSLAELVMLDDDSNAYIYRKNPALLEDLPDQPRV
uniref:Si:ch211-266i6.3 n=1 Tax=Neogobius melanostomus TaxID=47308 RepID=A0A8C6WQJ6_9GOBI